MAPKIRDLVGQKFGNLMVLELSKNRCKRGNARWICRCDCGKMHEVAGGNLCRGNTKSCGCLKRDNITSYHETFIGKVFGRLTVIDISSARLSGRPTVICKCECGKEYKVRIDSLKRGKTTECYDCCGESNGKNQIAKAENDGKRYKEIPGAHWATIKRIAKIRNLSLSISLEYIWDLFIKQDRKCALSGRVLSFDASTSTMVRQHQQGRSKTASLDRIDSSKGYIEGNVQWVHKDINRAKNVLSDEEFIKMCREVINHCDNKPLTKPPRYISGGKLGLGKEVY